MFTCASITLLNNGGKAVTARLKEIKNEIAALLYEAKEIVRRSNKYEYEKAKAYWVGPINAALNGNPMWTMEMTIQKLDDKNDMAQNNS